MGLPDAASYFNSGVLLMNLELMRRDDITDELRGCASGRGRALLWPDQDALNVVPRGSPPALAPALELR